MPNDFVIICDKYSCWAHEHSPWTKPEDCKIVRRNMSVTIPTNNP
jgi:hypothetical protein